MNAGSNRFGIIAALATGILFAASLDVAPFGALALVAPVPLLAYALAAPRAWRAAAAAAGARVLGLGGIFYAYAGVIPWPALAAAALLFAAVFALIVLITRWVARDARVFVAVLVYPLSLAAFEWMLGLAAPHGSFGAMGYSLVDVTVLLQLASLGGVPALTFCVALAPAAIAVAVVRPSEKRAALLTGLVPFAAALAFGLTRLHEDVSARARVALVAVDSTEAAAYRGEAQDVATAEIYARSVREIAGDKPQYIVLPEKQFGGGRTGARASAILGAAARDAAPATLVAGFDEVLADRTRVNSAQVSARGSLQRYVKRRLIPGVEEGYSVGTGPFVADTLGIAICKDMDFPAMIREYGRRDVTLMLVPAWDFTVDGRMHSRMAVVRGVENGFAIARAAAAGRLTVSDAFGRVVAEKVTSRDRAVTLVADVGLRSGGTIYSRVGDAFAWGCAVLTLGLVGWRASRRISGRSNDGRAARGVHLWARNRR